MPTEQTQTQRNRSWVQLQQRLQGRQYPDDPYIALAVDMFVSAIVEYQHPVPGDDALAQIEHDVALAFLRDVKSPWHQLMELDEEDIEGLLERLAREQPKKQGYRRPMTRRPVSR